MRELIFCDGDYEPATQPAQERLSITFATLPWMMNIRASNPSKGVTIWDVRKHVHTLLMAYTTRLEFEAQVEEMRDNIEKSFWKTRSSDVLLPKDLGLGPGIRRFDWLGEQTTFGGLVPEGKPDKLEKFGSDEAHVPVLRLLCSSDDKATAHCKCYYFTPRSR